MNIMSDKTNTGLKIPHLADLLKQSAEQKDLMEEIMENIFKNSAIASVTNVIGG